MDAISQIVQTTYNGLSLDNCDGLGRQILDLETYVYDTPFALTTSADGGSKRHRQLQLTGGSAFYANEQPQDKCQGVTCTETPIFFRLDCRANLCPVEDLLCLFCPTGRYGGLFRQRQLLSQNDSDEATTTTPTTTEGTTTDRVLSSYPYWDSVTDAVYDACLCAANQGPLPEILPELATIVEDFNTLIEKEKPFSKDSVLLPISRNMIPVPRRVHPTKQISSCPSTSRAAICASSNQPARTRRKNK